MKLLILYRPNSEHARQVEDFVHDFKRQMGADIKIDILDLNTREGAAMASVYDIVQYPALLATKDDGQVTQLWQGEMMPLMSEVASYVRV